MTAGSEHALEKSGARGMKHVLVTDGNSRFASESTQNFTQKGMLRLCRHERIVERSITGRGIRENGTLPSDQRIDRTQAFQVHVRIHAAEVMQQHVSEY